MILDASQLRYTDREQLRILQALELLHKNHEIVPESLVESVSKLTANATRRALKTLHKHKFISHNSVKNIGWKLNYKGFDSLALNALSKRGTILSIGQRIGVGKESDIHICSGSDESGDIDSYVAKIHRLGRASFRTIKNNRDYLGNRTSASWMYLSRIAAQKEFKTMTELYHLHHPIPKPISHNRHIIIMEYLGSCIRLSEIRRIATSMTFSDVEALYNMCIDILVSLCYDGVIHCDYNEFNLMVNAINIKEIKEKDSIDSIESELITNNYESDITSIFQYNKEIDNKINNRNFKFELFVIDFPQTITPNINDAEFYYERDLKAIDEFFLKTFQFSSYNKMIYPFTVKTYIKDKDENGINEETDETEFPLNEILLKSDLHFASEEEEEEEEEVKIKMVISVEERDAYKKKKLSKKMEKHIIKKAVTII